MAGNKLRVFVTLVTEGITLRVKSSCWNTSSAIMEPNPWIHSLHVGRSFAGLTSPAARSRELHGKGRLTSDADKATRTRGVSCLSRGRWGGGGLSRSKVKRGRWAGRKSCSANTALLSRTHAIIWGTATGPRERPGEALGLLTVLWYVRHVFTPRGGWGGGGSHFTVWDPSSAGEWDQTGWDGMKGCRGWMRRRKNENKWDMRMFWEKMRTLLFLREESRWFFFIHLVNENIWDHNVETEVTPTLFFAWDEIWRVDPEEDVNFTKPAKWDDRIKHEMKLCDVRLEKTRKTIRNVLDGTDEMRWVQKI